MILCDDLFALDMSCSSILTPILGVVSCRISVSQDFTPHQVEPKYKHSQSFFTYQVIISNLFVNKIVLYFVYKMNRSISKHWPLALLTSVNHRLVLDFLMSHCLTCCISCRNKVRM